MKNGQDNDKSMKPIGPRKKPGNKGIVHAIRRGMRIDAIARESKNRGITPAHHRWVSHQRQLALTGKKPAMDALNEVNLRTAREVVKHTLRQMKIRNLRLRNRLIELRQIQMENRNEIQKAYHDFFSAKNHNEQESENIKKHVHRLTKSYEEGEKVLKRLLGDRYEEYILTETKMIEKNFMHRK